VTVDVQRTIGGGAYVEYDMAARLAELGDRLVPPSMVATLPAIDGLPAIRLAIVVRDGIPVCRRIEIESAPEGRDVRQADLDAINVDDLIERVCSAVGARVLRRTDADSDAAAWEWNDANAVEPAARSGRPVRLSDERIRRAAEVYRAHLHERPTQAVAAAFGIAPRTAAKYVGEARIRGFLPPTTPGKKQA